jgi:hypothetical protein
MRWLMIALLVSVGALLLAVAGAARHILRQRARLKGDSSADSGAGVPAGRPKPFGAVEETDHEL